MARRDYDDVRPTTRCCECRCEVLIGKALLVPVGNVKGHACRACTPPVIARHLARHPRHRVTRRRTITVAI